MRTAILIGISRSEFDFMTPYELLISAEAFEDRRFAEFQKDVTIAWLGEYYHRTKSLPALKDALAEISKEENRREMTDDEMLAEVKRIHAILGGTTIEPQKSGE